MVTLVTVPNLQELRRMAPGIERIQAADAYIAEREQAIEEARKLRDADIRTLIELHGPAKAARLAGRSLSTIKIIRGRS